jgi:hypothetical protein
MFFRGSLFMACSPNTSPVLGPEDPLSRGFIKLDALTPPLLPLFDDI